MTYTTKTIKDKVEYLFPFRKPNPGQLEAIVDICDAILNKNQKHIIIQAPTGIGKSAIATTVHNVVAQLLGERFRTTVITTSKSLQDQYVDTCEIEDLRGKTNYGCAFNVGPYKSPRCRSLVGAGTCNPGSKCDYIKARRNWSNDADLRLTNHSFQIEAGPGICIDEENKADLIVIDECHDIDTNIIEHTSIDIDIGEYASLSALGQRAFIDKATELIASYKRQPVGVAFQPTKAMFMKMYDLQEMSENLIGDLEGKINFVEGQVQRQIGSALEALSSISEKLKLYSNNEKNTWMINVYEEGKKLILKPVFASSVAHFALFRKARFFLHMSATICGFETYKSLLGIHDAITIDVPNPIPIDKRKVYVIPKIKVSGNIDYLGLSKLVDDIVNHHSGESGIIHTVSFQLANDLTQRCVTKSRFLTTGDYKEATDHLKKRGSVILSPSLEKGFDAKGDMSRFQIIAKVPYLFLGDPLVKLHSLDNKNWYARKTILRLVQACGRSVRGVDDYAATYIIDSNFLRLMQDNIDLFPEWFIDAVEFV